MKNLKEISVEERKGLVDKIIDIMEREIPDEVANKIANIIVYGFFAVSVPTLIYAGYKILSYKPEPPIPITKGIIIEKRYEPQREYNSGFFVPPSIYIPGEKMIDDEDYIIIFGKKDEKNRFRTRKVYVTEEVFNSLKIKDTFDVSKYPYEDSDPDYKEEDFKRLNR